MQLLARSRTRRRRKKKGAIDITTTIAKLRKSAAHERGVVERIQMGTEVAGRSIDADDQPLAGDQYHQRIGERAGRREIETQGVKDAGILPPYHRDLLVPLGQEPASTDPEDGPLHQKSAEETVPQETEITIGGRGGTRLLLGPGLLLQKDDDHLTGVNHTLPVETLGEMVRMDAVDMIIAEMGATIGEKIAGLRRQHETHRTKTRRLNGNGSWLPCNRMLQVWIWIERSDWQLWQSRRRPHMRPKTKPGLDHQSMEIRAISSMGCIRRLGIWAWQIALGEEGKGSKRMSNKLNGTILFSGRA